MRKATAVRNAQLASSQPAREENIAVIVAHLRAGAKAECRRVGIELEHICVDGTGDPITYSQPNGVRDVLAALQEKYPEATVHGGDLLGVARPGAAVTIEPAAQLELSAGPFENLIDAKRVFLEFEDDAYQALSPIGGRALTLGFDPVNRAADKELIPKTRYDYMNEYLSSIGPWGPRMMRGSASTQISIDYLDEADCIAKMRVAQVLAPLFALMCDNTPVFEGSRRPHALMRTEIWKYCDPDRCNSVPGIFDEGFDFEDYAAYLLDVPAIVALDDDGEARYDTRTFGEIFAHRAMTDDEVFHAMSMVFPDVRLKSYVEIRPADSMPIPYVLAYAALVKGLFYGKSSLETLVRSCAGISESDVAKAKDALMESGYAAEVYQRSAAEICDELITLARRACRRPSGASSILCRIGGAPRNSCGFGYFDPVVCYSSRSRKERFDLMLNTFRAHAGQFMKIAAIACALCLAMAALAGCSSSDSQQEKTPAQVNREYMSSVNSISQEAASALSNFSDAAAKQDVAAMRVAASNATKALDKIAALEAPDALKDVKSEYEAGANDLGQALSDYVEIYAQIKNAGENLDAAAEAAKGIDDVKARYDSGIEHLSKADSMVADMADSSTSDDASK